MGKETKRIKLTLLILAVLLAVITTFPSEAYAANQGWIYQNGAYYYVESNGTLRKNNWAAYKGSYYYLGKDGKVSTRTWVSYKGSYYYVGKDGKLVTNAWAQYNGAYYYLGADGSVVTNNWIVYGGKEYYLGPDGKPYVNKSVVIGFTRYYFDETGACTMDRLEDGPLVYTAYSWRMSSTNPNYRYRVPFINSNGADVDAINSRLFNLTQEAREIELLIKDNPSYYSYVNTLEIDYEYSVNDNVLSLVVWIKYDANSWVEYFTVCIDTNTGRTISTQQLLQQKGISSTTYYTWLYGALKNAFLTRFPISYRDYLGEAYDMAYNSTVSLKNIKNSVLFLNKQGQLVVMAQIYELAGPELSYTFIPVNI